jgi:hypothetical protein
MQDIKDGLRLSSGSLSAVSLRELTMFPIVHAQDCRANSGLGVLYWAAGLLCDRFSQAPF